MASALDALLKIHIPNISPSEKPDHCTQEELDDFVRQQDLEQKRIETAIKQHELTQRTEEHSQRVGFAKKMFWLISVWLFCILLVVVAAGSNCKYFSLDLSDRVLITLLTSTTVTVLGLFVTVLKYLFGRK